MLLLPLHTIVSQNDVTYPFFTQKPLSEILHGHLAHIRKLPFSNHQFQSPFVNFPGCNLFLHPSQWSLHWLMSSHPMKPLGSCWNSLKWHIPNNQHWNELKTNFIYTFLLSTHPAFPFCCWNKKQIGSKSRRFDFLRWSTASVTFCSKQIFQHSTWAGLGRSQGNKLLRCRNSLGSLLRSIFIFLAWMLIYVQSINSIITCNPKTSTLVLSVG